jgi:hypothetical protein
MKVIQYKLLKKWSYPMYYQDASFNYWLSKQLYSQTGYPFAAAIYARLVQRFPQPPVFVDTTNVTLPAVPTTPPAPPVASAQLVAENSGCLAAVFEHLGGLDELAPNELVDTGGYNNLPDGIPEIVDSWGMPLMYDRFPVTSANYDPVKLAFWNNFMLMRARLAFPAKFPTPPAPQIDPDDPEGLLLGLSTTAPNNQMAALDAIFNNFGTAIPPFRTTFDPAFYPAYTPLVIYSAGGDRTFGQLSPVPNFGLDDLDSYSWRVTVQGQ